MAAANIISVIGTGITLLSFLLDNVPDAPSQAKLSYIIANDGANGDLTSAGGDLPDVRLWDETGEFLGITVDPGNCPEGYTTCETQVNTQEAPTYTLFTGNDDAICIAWTGLAWAGGQKKYGFHPGNWAAACDLANIGNNGVWYYAGTKVPGINADDDVRCAWVDRNGDIETTGFQVHWPEFDANSNGARGLDYYCNNSPPVYYHTEYEPSSIYRWVRKNNIFRAKPSVEQSPAVPSPDEKKRAVKAQADRINKRMALDPRLIKSHFKKHLASELCNPDLNTAGQSFVSYEEEKFCYMPTKTVYDFCKDVKTGACWDDDKNEIVVKGDANRVAVPDLSHIKNVTVWG